MKKELELYGLRPILIGFIVELVAFLLVGRAANGLMNGSPLMAALMAAATLVGMLLVFRGLQTLEGASYMFGKAKKHILIRAVIAAILLVLVLALGRKGSMTAGMLTGMPRGVLLEATIAFLVVGVIWIVAVLLSGRAILRGCGDVAEQADDPIFSLKCMKTWRIWGVGVLLMVLVILASLAIILNVLSHTLKSGKTGAELNEAIMTNVTSGALLASIIVLVGMAIFLVVHILFLLRIRYAYKTYHLEMVRISADAAEDAAPYIGVEGEAEASFIEVESEEEAPYIEGEEGEDA